MGDDDGVGFPGDIFEALAGGDPGAALRALDAAGRLTATLPELEAGRGFVQPELHYYTVLDHNLAAVDALTEATAQGEAGRELRAVLAWIDVDESLDRPVDGVPLLPLLRLAALLHDVAKPHTAARVDGRLRFPRHGPTGAEMMAERLTALELPAGAVDFVTRLIRYHLRPGVLVRPWPPTDRAVRKFVADLDGHVLPLMLLNLADGWATRGPGYTRENYRRHLEFVNLIVGRCVGLHEPGEPRLITGDDLIEELNLSGGRLLGAVLTSVGRAQDEGSIATRDEALALARTLLPTLAARFGESPASRADDGDS